MPTYDYKCGGCGHKWEEFQSITATATKKCPSCKKLKAERVIGPGAGILFKGSGFYLTDYRSEGYKKAAEADKKASEGGSTKSETSGKSESKGSSETSGKGEKKSSGKK